MINVDFDMEEFRAVIREEIHAAVKDAVQDALKHQDLPLMLTRQELKEFLQISDSKSYELIGRPDFPVLREAGVRIPRNELLKWVADNLDWNKS